MIKTILYNGIVQYASLHRFTMSSEQQEFVKWAWEVGLMLKLHPNQLLSRSMQTLSPINEQHSQQSEFRAPITTSIIIVYLYSLSR